MIARSTRRAVAWIGILGIVAAQFALTAHACSLGASAAAGSGGVAVAAAHQPAAHPCGHAAEPVGVPNLCEVHCSDGATAGSAPDLPQVSLAPLPVAVAPFAIAASTHSTVLARPAALPGAPPPALQFCRLLI